MANNETIKSEGQTEVLQEERISEPDRYRVLLHNDDYTTMGFVVAILRAVFNKNPQEAEAIMLTVHENGVGQCGIYTKEVAETKVHMVKHEARLAGFPLRCSMEKV